MLSYECGANPNHIQTVEGPCIQCGAETEEL